MIGPFTAIPFISPVLQNKVKKTLYPCCLQSYLLVTITSSHCNIFISIASINFLYIHDLSSDLRELRSFCKLNTGRLFCDAHSLNAF